MTRRRALQITGEGACTFQSTIKTFRAQKSLQNDLKECQDDGLDFEHVDNTIYFDDVFVLSGQIQGSTMKTKQSQ